MNLQPPPYDATQRQVAQYRQNRKRAARIADNRCPDCGRQPEPGKVRCLRCIEFAKARSARAAERRRARRAAELRAAAPRRCSGCGGDDLTKSGIMGGRQYYRCRACGRRSTGDGPPTPSPDYPCPYCRARCIKRGTRRIGPRVIPRFQCTACKRYNSRLWPEFRIAPGGPFPHQKTFCLTYPAREALILYCQTHKMSVPSAIRDIFIRAGKAPLARITMGRTDYDRDGRPSHSVKHVDIRGSTPIPQIPEGVIRLPSAMPDARLKLNKMRNGSDRYNPTILIATQVNVALSDDALAGLLETMRRRGLNHQDAARQLLIETMPLPNRNVASRYNDPDEDWA